MQQEARNTETHNRLWSNSNLRHKAVKFVSAGEVQRSEFEIADREDRDTRSEIDTASESPKPEIEKPPAPTEDPQENVFYFDSTGQTTIETGFPDPIPRHESNDSDDTSEDEVVFTGRNNPVKPVIIDTDNDELRKLLHTVTPKQSTASTAPEMEQVVTQKYQSDTSQCDAASHVRQRQMSPAATDPLADYIANIDHDYYEEEDEGNSPSYKQFGRQSGVDVGTASAGSESSNGGSIDLEVEPPRATRRQGTCAEDTEEFEVQSSIDGK